jgi:hypothetical protein
MGTEALILLAVAALFLLNGKAHAATSVGGSARGTPPSNDGAALVKRANSGRAGAWTTFLTDQGISQELAGCLARWIGIESGGNPLAVSPMGERGLLQAMPNTGAVIFTPGEWAALTDKATTNAEHARLAIKEFDWLWGKAAARVSGDVAALTDTDRAFYAKLYHQWPRDFWAIKMHGPALAMAGVLAKTWEGQPKALHRLKAASVVAWNNPEPWGGNA